MNRSTRAFVGVGSNASDAVRQLTAALAGLDTFLTRVVAAARPRWTAYVGGDGPDVLNTVVEIVTKHTAQGLLQSLHDLERAAGRDRGDPTQRTLDLDILTFGDDRIDEPGLSIPHKRALDRAFVLAPWAEIAPLAVVPGTGKTVCAHSAALQQRAPDAFEGHRMEAPLPFADRSGGLRILKDAHALRAWRASCQRGTVGVVPTMGALHAGHGSLAQRAASECDFVVATLFVNPLQFAPGEDLDRYPRTFDEDCARLRAHGVDAIYAPEPSDLYPSDFSTHVVPRAMADCYEGATRPTHFEGVTTIVTKLLLRTQPDRAYFAHKDAQQLAIIRRLVRDLDLPGTVCPCTTVREASGLAMSSRNRFLSASEQTQALTLSAALRAMRAAAAGTSDPAAVVAAGSAVFSETGLTPDYLAVVDPDSFDVPDVLGASACLAIGALPVGAVRLLDNRWLACTVG